MADLLALDPPDYDECRSLSQPFTVPMGGRRVDRTTWIARRNRFLQGQAHTEAVRLTLRNRTHAPVDTLQASATTWVVTIADVLGGVPVISVMGTPRTIGETIGARLKPRLQVLAQYLLEQLAAGLSSEGRNRLGRDDIRKALKPSLEAATRLEPAVWMELESMAFAADLPPEDLLLIHGYGDLVGFFKSGQTTTRSTFASLNAVHTDHGLPRMVLAWHLDPALLPYVHLVRRLPAHGPGSLTLTLAGLQPVAGLSEAGLAVACNELRIDDGAPGHLTPTMIAAAMTAPSQADAISRVQAGPRHGGACIHLLNAEGERASFELSGQRIVRLPDPWPQSPRVHCNQPLADEIRLVASRYDEPTSRSRLERIAAMAIEARSCTPAELLSWFRMNPRSHTTGEVGTAKIDGITPDSTVLMICDPAQRTVHIQRGGNAQGIGSASL
jgi:hypothetical protein